MKKIIKKADEMEMEINMKAARFAFGFLEIAIMGYCIAEKITTGEFPTPIFIFGILGMLIFNERIKNSGRKTWRKSLA